jgi:hypothetical protein
VGVSVDGAPPRDLHDVDRRHGVVAVAVAEHDGVQVAEVDLQLLYVVEQRVPVVARV